MVNLSNLLSSNLAEITFTYLAGLTAYAFIAYPLRRYVVSVIERSTALSAQDAENHLAGLAEKAVNFLTAALFATILASFLFDLGETYQYSYWYKRSFSYLGDGFPFIAIMLLAFHLQKQSRTYAALALSVLVLSGGKMVMLSALLTMAYIKRIGRACEIRRDFFWPMAASFAVYFSALAASNVLIPTSLKVELNEYIATHLLPQRASHDAREGRAACQTIERCYSSQLILPFRQRVTSSFAGAWMTLQGGFRGAAYPNTPSEFADFMMEHNPWGINERFGMTWDDWRRTRSVQNPYLNFGSGYGLTGLVILAALFWSLAVLGLRNIRHGHDRVPWSALSIYHVMLVFFNQTQPWMQGGSLLLFFAGVSSAHILLTYAANSRYWTQSL